VRVSAIVLRDGSVRFCETDNHTHLIIRLGLDGQKDDGNNFVRVVLTDDNKLETHYELIPEWFERRYVKILQDLIYLRQKIEPARRIYESNVRGAGRFSLDEILTTLHRRNGPVHDQALNMKLSCEKYIECIRKIPGFVPLEV